LEEHPETSGFQIKNAKIPITIAMKRLEFLKPHEEIIEEELLSLSRSISHDKVLRHPLVADFKTGVVLDGNHRLVALRQMNCRLAPVAFVDYKSPQIVVERWYRVIRFAKLDDLQARLQGLGLNMRYEDPATAAELLNRRRVAAVIEDQARSLVFSPQSQDPLERFRTSFSVETFLRQTGLGVSYLDKRPEIIQGDTLILSTIRLEKEEVVAVASSGRLYPPKSTRHLIPSRPLGIRVPIEWLAIDKPEIAQAKLMEHLGKMKLRRTEKGSIVGSRKYEEEVFVFE
jgi:L-serine kinase (ADP)